MTETITVVGGGGTLVVSSLGPATTRLFTGAGSSGLVPDPGAGSSTRVLRSDGTWGAQSGGGGGGSGDMEAEVYDPTGVEDDAFDMANMVEAANAKVLTAAERTKLAGIETGATADQSAAEVPFTAGGGVSSTNVQAAIAELDVDKANAAHSHAIADVTGLQTALDGKAASSHTHATSEVTGLDAALAGKAASSHTHATSDVTGLDAALAGKAASSHTHSISDVTGLQTALDGKAASSHTHSDATTSVAGFMSAADKTKLDGVAANANNYTHPAHSGDVTSSGDGATTIAADVVDNSKLANVATETVKARTTAGTGDPEDVTFATLADKLSAEFTAKLATNQSFSSTTYAVLVDWDTTRIPTDWFTYDGATGEFTIVKKCRVTIRACISVVLNTAGSAVFQMRPAIKTAPATYAAFNDFLATQLVLSTLDGAANCHIDLAFSANAGDVYVLQARRPSGSQQIDTKIAWCFMTLGATLRP